MTTQSLRGMANHGPMHWRGDRTGGNDAAERAARRRRVRRGRRRSRSSTSPSRACSAAAARSPQPRCRRSPTSSSRSPIRRTRSARSTTRSRADQTAGRNFYFDSDPSDAVGTCNGCHVLDVRAGASSAATGSRSIEPQAVKIPHLRNLYQKVGMFGMPRLDGALLGINPGDNGFKGDQIRGFGFLHDGSIDTLFRFFNLTGFNQSGGNSGGFTSDTARRQMEAFMLAFDSNLAPIVGQQITLTADQRGHRRAAHRPADSQRGRGRCDLVVKGVLAGEARGWHRTRGGNVPQRSRGGAVARRRRAARARRQRRPGAHLHLRAAGLGRAHRHRPRRGRALRPRRARRRVAIRPTRPACRPRARAALVIGAATLKVKKNQDPAGDEKLVVKGERAARHTPIDPGRRWRDVHRQRRHSGSVIYSRAVPGGLAPAPSAPGLAHERRRHEVDVQGHQRRAGRRRHQGHRQRPQRHRAGVSIHHRSARPATSRSPPPRCRWSSRSCSAAQRINARPSPSTPTAERRRAADCPAAERR